jgi:hypothetical protein
MDARRTLVAMAVVVLSGISGPALADETVVLRLYDSAGLRRSDAVQATVRRILVRSGIRTVWMLCNEPGAHVDKCPGDLADHDFVVRVRPGLPPDGSGTCAAALRPDPPARGHFISIYADCTARVADRFVVPVEVVVAYCLVHEVGHLLLPTDDHESSGIMAPMLGAMEWRLAAAGRLSFSETQAAQMRASLRR